MATAAGSLGSLNHCSSRVSKLTVLPVTFRSLRSCIPLQTGTSAELCVECGERGGVGRDGEGRGREGMGGGGS